MKIAVIGAGAMGCLYGGRLGEAGFDVTLVDIWREHVDAINRSGLRLDGIGGDRTIRVRAATVGSGDVAPADVAIVFVDANATAEAARECARVLRPDGHAVTFQNGIGNVEALVEVLGRGRVVGGSSYHSAALQGPGHARHTHAGPTRIGELDGARTPRLAALNDALARAGLNPAVADDVMAYIWQKFVLNCAINPVSAITGLRLGEIARTPAVDAFQDRLLDEILAVVAAKGLRLPDPDIRGTIKRHCRMKYNKPSMLQHVEQGKRTEIDALNGALVREAQALGLEAPFNEALALLIKGLERHRRQVVHEPPIDYAALEAQAATSPP